ncbi:MULTISPECIES: succinate dehydrogenase [Acidiplasma]|jgi:succinate dehydrogenase / fumarate reductase cytochrome b subunit|uniref:Succinate dehydrogenase n=2 Tax=Acidiplasma TaxID=507753 RepID=A0A0Q0RWJ3_9ARCH|nr:MULTISPECIES: succinate dehydrogenase [Acidiplasma]KJE48639.1 succinate dehydrogenase [Acidiplasma sp. MBA-1]KPV47594.1 succinate dehydrogenase [Acidiplasma aeolicum]KQB34247.1 succinate dehydrogenase [Acidiplasma cupricumulans]KQB34655.1 succinate dehydrogenase [Acidiplasma aeolicum]WMT55393.1 MAG: succinate dehydrogenase [Acidiplasma sp.]
MNKTGIAGWFNIKDKGTGYFAFAFQRFSGLVIVIYLYMHLIFLSSLLDGRTTYNSLVQNITYGPFDIFIVMDMLLALVIFYHGANGIRLALNEFGIGLKHHKLFFYAYESISMVLLVLFLYYAYLFLGGH